MSGLKTYKTYKTYIIAVCVVVGGEGLWFAAYPVKGLSWLHRLR